MSDGNDSEVCELCEQGNVIKRDETMSFYQWTSRGYVFCRVKILMGVCDRCGMKSWDESAEAVIEEAVRRECDKLP